MEKGISKYLGKSCGGNQRESEMIKYLIERKNGNFQ